MSKYIGLIQEELDDDFEVGYNISSNLKKLLKWKEEMLECGNVIKCKVFKIEEINE